MSDAVEGSSSDFGLGRLNLSSENYPEIPITAEVYPETFQFSEHGAIVVIASTKGTMVPF